MPVDATGTAVDGASSRSTRAAVLLSDVFAPPWVMLATQLVVAWHVTSSTAQALRWAVLTGMFTAVVPYAFVLLGVRLGRWSDRHIRVRHQRLVPTLFGLSTCLLGLVLLNVWGAPVQLLVVLVAIIASIPPFVLINVWWKISIHAGCMGGSLVVLTDILGAPAAVAGAAVLPLTSWARVRLRDHTTGQVIAGALLGAVVVASVYLPLR
ncbi:phosphatase PAP2 family protein [Kineococcus gypseus]|uniref:phosphoesterase PA-phosphatase n=1 Tax=Kineococcus gypseus TaxID=1637102 RepID=UPI003D7C6183